MSDGSTWHSLYAWSLGGHLLVTLACNVVILVVVTTVVRRHRPDAYRTLQLWSILTPAALVILGGAKALLPRLVAREGLDTYFRSITILSMVETGVHILLAVLLVRGLVAIAQPPKPAPAAEGAPPYR